jgi:hypothetical protein
MKGNRKGNRGNNSLSLLCSSPRSPPAAMAGPERKAADPSWVLPGEEKTRVIRPPYARQLLAWELVN